MSLQKICFGEARNHQIFSNTRHVPILITTSLKGDILIVYETEKQLLEYKDTVYVVVLYPYIDNVYMKGTSFIRTIKTNEDCLFWEIEGFDHLTHICFDRKNTIYFTNGETLYRISYITSTSTYVDDYEDIFSPSNDTSHITSLWQQKNKDTFFCVQDWDHEDNIDIYKVKYERGNTTTGNDSPRTGSPRGRSRSPSFGQRRRTNSRGNISSGSLRYGSQTEVVNEYVQKMRTFTLQYNRRIWQLGWMTFEKKFVLAMGAAHAGSSPIVLRIGFKTKIKVLNIVKSNIVWPSYLTENMPHAFYYHRPTKTWFMIIPVQNKKIAGKLFWLQFKFDQQKKKVIWHRLVPVPEGECCTKGEWLYYDDIRDVLIGYYGSNKEEQEYIVKYLPDMSKYLWIESMSAAVSSVDGGLNKQRTRKKSVAKDAAAVANVRRNKKAVVSSIKNSSKKGGKGKKSKYKKNGRKKGVKKRNVNAKVDVVADEGMD